MNPPKKRKAEDSQSNHNNGKKKVGFVLHFHVNPDAIDEFCTSRHRADSKQRGKTWQTHSQLAKREHRKSTSSIIEPGDSGIWVTCEMNKEAQSVGDFKAILAQYTADLLPDSSAQTEDAEGKADEPDDIEAEIRNEVQDLHASRHESLFTNVKVSDMVCVLFFKTKAPIVPTTLVHRICSDASASRQKHSRFIKRLTPMTLIGKATEAGLRETAEKVLKPYFHDGGVPRHTFAIRPTTRNSNILRREVVIQTVASVVGPDHRVDLQNPDLVILVEVYKNICGLAVVGQDYAKLKRYNLAEICHPSSESNAIAPLKTSTSTGATDDGHVDGASVLGAGLSRQQGSPQEDKYM